MPAWQSLLSQDERWSVIDYLRTFTYESELETEVTFSGPTPTSAEIVDASACDAAQANPLSWEDTDAIQKGQALYLVQCAMCHGPDGSGGLPQTPDFTSVEINDALLADPGPSFCSVTEGRGVMPAFGTSLTEQERWQLITYVGSLGP
jgi:mono/diheme cytochrome c family protein